MPEPGSSAAHRTIRPLHSPFAPLPALAAVGFFTTVATVAAAFDHYPTMAIEEKRLRITVTTPGLGLTEADFALVERIEELASGHEIP